MKNEKKFKVVFNGAINILPKSTIKFIYGYGVVIINFNYIKDETILNNGEIKGRALGVVDSNFRNIVSPEGYYSNIDIYPKGNFIIEKKFCLGEGEHSCSKFEYEHYRQDGYGKVGAYKLKFSKYEKMSFRIIKIIGDDFQIFYDVVTGRYCSKKFTKIGNFKMYGSGEYALAYAIADGKIKRICFLNKKGEIARNIYNVFDAPYIDLTAPDFDSTIEKMGVKVLTKSR